MEKVRKTNKDIKRQPSSRRRELVLIYSNPVEMEVEEELLTPGHQDSRDSVYGYDCHKHYWAGKVYCVHKGIV